MCMSFFSFLDRKILDSAAGVNVVSEGFPEYFEKKGIDTSNWSFFPNGVDDEFLRANQFHQGLTVGQPRVLLKYQIIQQ